MTYEPTDEHAQNLIRLADDFGAHFNISHWRVSFLLRGNGQFIKGLKDGNSCTGKTYSKCITWFDSKWPSDLEWPISAPRPSQLPKQRAELS